MKVPSFCSCVNSPGGDSLQLRIMGEEEGCSVQGLPNQGASVGALQDSEGGGGGVGTSGRHRGCTGSQRFHMQRARCHKSRGDAK